jgi:predicted DNA repair protein MutK
MSNPPKDENSGTSGFRQRIGGGLSGGSSAVPEIAATVDGGAMSAMGGGVMVSGAIALTLAVQAARQEAMFVTPSGQQGHLSESAAGMSPAQGIAAGASAIAAMALTTGTDNNS